MEVIKSMSSFGIQAEPILVESRLASGLPQTIIIGLASKQVGESKDRLRAAFNAQGFRWPRKRITVNLRPTAQIKTDSALDLAIAVSILINSEQISTDSLPDLNQTVFIGEIALNGSVQPVNYLISKLSAILKSGIKSVVLPASQIDQALNVVGARLSLLPINQLSDICNLTPTSQAASINNNHHRPQTYPDITTIRGQLAAKRAILIAAAGGHNLLMVGPPGIGKTLLARSLAGLLPELNKPEAIKVSQIYEHFNDLAGSLIYAPPVREPHPNISTAKLLGSASKLEPGEISLASYGVLILNELNEFKHGSLEALRQPLEDRYLPLSFSKRLLNYPADFILVATSNPCPCGFYGSKKLCKCSVTEIKKYNNRLSGPLLDRFDLYINIPGVDTFTPESASQDSLVNLKQIVRLARQAQIKRFGCLNSRVSHQEIGDQTLDPSVTSLLNSAAYKLELSQRARDKTIRLARTIADIEQSPIIKVEHISEALQLRPPKLLLPIS